MTTVPHEVLALTGGAIGQGLPSAVGAAMLSDKALVAAILGYGNWGHSCAPGAAKSAPTACTRIRVVR